MKPAPDLASLRRELHAHPEVSGDERKTAGRVLAELERLEPDGLERNLGGHGILATFGCDTGGPQALVRCELDALPIHEVNTFAHRSVHTGVAHMCGHDGHMAILLGLARKLAEHRPAGGQAHLLFQPAEETGAGAAAVLQDPRMLGRAFGLVLALHNIPGIPMGTVAVRKGAFTASVSSLVIALGGKTSHAAEPELGLNPAMAVARIITGVLALQHNDPDSDRLRVVTVVHVTLGTKDYGISAGSAEVHLTVRCWTDAGLRALEQEIAQEARRVAGAEGLSVDIRRCFAFQANRNDGAATELVVQAARDLGLHVAEREHPFKWGEDFGAFTARYKGCMFGLGAGVDSPALHNPDYDFPDELIPTGSALFDAAVRAFLER